MMPGDIDITMPVDLDSSDRYVHTVWLHVEDTLTNHIELFDVGERKEIRRLEQFANALTEQHPDSFVARMINSRDQINIARQIILNAHASGKMQMNDVRKILNIASAAFRDDEVTAP